MEKPRFSSLKAEEAGQGYLRVREQGVGSYQRSPLVLNIGISE